MSALLRDNDSQNIARNSGHKLPTRRNPAFNARLKVDRNRSRGQRPRFTLQKNIRPVGQTKLCHHPAHMPQSLHVLSAHIIFSTKGRQPWLTQNIRERVWAYQSRILQNLECNSITIGGAADHVHVLCNLTKKFPTAKVVEILKKDSSKFIKTLGVPTVSLAGWLRAVQCKSFSFRGCTEIHSRSTRASQNRNVSKCPEGVALG